MPSRQRLVELARVARLGTAVGEDHGPGHVGGAAVQFAIDEVGEAAEEQAEGAPTAR